MILCAGECLIDMLPFKGDDGISALRPVAGGAVMNTAIGLGRLEAPVQFVSGVSNDQFGDMIVEHLRSSGVPTESVIFSDRPTTLAFVAVNDGVVSYDFYDEATAGRMLSPDQMPAVSKEAKALFFGGISLISEPAADTYATFLQENADGRLVVMDPNIRPAFIKDEAAYRARLYKMLAQTDVVKSSDEDLEWLFPDAPSIEAAIKALQNLGPSIVLFTEGAKGATAFRSKGSSIFVASEKVRVVDTVGAGDTFNAGFLAGLSDQGALTGDVSDLTDDVIKSALAFAAKCAAISVGRAGAQPPWRHEV